MEESGLITNETPRGQARMSVHGTSPMAIENEVELVNTFLDQLDEQLRQSQNMYFGSQLSIADVLYFWEISTV